MQQKLVLYIGNVSVYTEDERVDQFKDESVSFTQTIQNVKDIKKIFTEFTKTFALPASKKNNKIFDHYYNYDIANGFDARRKVNASLELNDYNTDYNYSTIVLKLAAGANDNLIVPLITHTDRLEYNGSNSAAISDVNGNLYFNPTFNNNGVDYKQLKYALRLSAIIDAIQTQYPITFSNDFFNNTSNTEFENLFMWLHRKKGNVTPAEDVEIIWTTVDELYQSFCTPIGNCVEIATVDNGIVSLPDSTQYLSNATSLTITPDQTNTDYSIRVLKDGDTGNIIEQRINVQNTQVLFFNQDPLPLNASYTIQIASDPSAPAVTFQGFNGSISGIAWYFQFKDLFNLADPSSWPDQQFRNANTFSTNNTIEFNITQQIPKMKIIDFLTGIFQMFNLTAYVEDGIIVVQPLNDFYDKAPKTTNPLIIPPQVIPVNIDKYLDTTKSTVDIALPFKEVNFNYKGLNTFLAKQFNQLFNAGWGSQHFTLNNEYYDAPSEKYSIELPFEHVMYERLYNSASGGETSIMYGYFVDSNRESYFGLPLLFYGYKRTTGTPMAIREAIGSVNSITNYWLPMNTLELNSTTSKVNIHFGQELSEYQANQDGGLANDFTDTLFETKYKDYVQDVFNPARRLTKVTAYLPYKIFSSLQLYDRIEIGQKYYKINSMTTNLTTGKTEFELLNTDL